MPRPDAAAAKSGARPGLSHLAFMVLLVFAGAFGIMAAGCRQQTREMPPVQTALPRPNPSYLAWLEQQSMLSRAPALAAEVSGSGRAFANHDAPKRTEILLRAAPSWLWLNPAEISGRQPLARQISSAGLIAKLASLGISGLFLAPLAESGSIWAESGASRSGWDATSLFFSQTAGTEEEIAEIYADAEKNGIQTGGELPSAATGIGPDFMLQARGAPRHGGLYAMVSVPRDNWQLLPKPVKEWPGEPLPAREEEELQARGILPAPLARDQAGFAGGWAATGEIAGADGQIRRWLYRHAQNPGRPVLLWQDPSGAAKSIFSAAIIRQTGLLGQTLTGLRIAPLLGLEEGSGEILEPGLEAVAALAREIHRYGGWAMQNDPVPTALVGPLLAGPLDFCVECQSGAAAVQALQSGDASALYNTLLEIRALPLSRTARGAMQEEAPAMRPENIFRALQQNSRTPSEDKFVNACLLALAFRMGLPGLAMFAPDEIGLADFGQTALIPASYLEKLRAAVSRVLLFRAKSGLALGTLQSAHGGKDGWVAALSQLPDGSLWLCAANYGSGQKMASIKLPFAPQKAIEAQSGAEIDCLRGTKTELTLDGNAVRHVIFYGRQRD